MKKTFLFAAALAVLSLASCKKDDKPQVPAGPDTDPEVPGIVNDDINNWKLYADGYYQGVSSTTMTEVEEGDTKYLKWVFASGDAYANYGVLVIDPKLDLKNADAEKACLKFRFKVENDGGPMSQHTLFRVYFGSLDGNKQAKDVWVGGIGRGAASLEWYDYVVNDSDWHELTLPLKDYISELTGVGAAYQLGFTPKDAPAAAGTTVLFNNIRLENCAVSHPSSDDPTVDPKPDTPKEFTPLIYDDAVSGTWVLDGASGKYAETTEEHSAGTKSVKWYCASGWFASTCVFKLANNENKDISSYSKLKFDVKITVTGNASEHPFEPGDETFTIRIYGGTVNTDSYSEAYYVYRSRTTDEGGEGDWHTVEVPIKTSTDADAKWDCFVLQSGSNAYPFKHFNQFCFHSMEWSGNAGNVYIDNVTLVK